MKNFIAIMLLMVASVFAAAPTGAAVDGVYEYDIDTLISASTGFDTLAASDDSSALTGYWTPERGNQKAWEYILVTGAITGTSADSLDLRFRLDCYTSNSSFLYSIWIDSLADSPVGKAMIIPIAQTAFGEKFKLKAVARNGGTALQAILNQIAIYKRRPLTLMIRP